MSEETENRNPLYQVEELWKQWYATSSKVWSEAAPPMDPFTLFKQWYESSHETWSNSLEEIISNEKFVEAASHYMESYATFYKNFRTLNEDFFSHLQLSTRSDLTRVAEMIIALENKVDGIQDAFEDFQHLYPQFATLASIQQLTVHQQSLEQQLDQLSARSQKIDADLHEHLHTIEHKLNAIPPTLQKLDVLQEPNLRLGEVEHSLGELPSTLQKLDALQGLSQRLDTIEGRLDELPSSLQKLDALPGLSQRLDTIEGRLDELPKLDALQGLSQHLDSIEGRLDELPSALHRFDALQGLDTRLSGIEEKLHALPTTLHRDESSAHLEKPLDGAEQKLDKLVALLEHGDTLPAATKTTATKTSRSGSSKTRTSPKIPQTLPEEITTSTEE